MGFDDFEGLILIDVFTGGDDIEALAIDLGGADGMEVGECDSFTPDPFRCVRGGGIAFIGPSGAGIGLE